MDNFSDKKTGNSAGKRDDMLGRMAMGYLAPARRQGNFFLHGKTGHLAKVSSAT